MPKEWDNIAFEVNLLVEAIKHFAGVEHVTLLAHDERSNLFKILVSYRNRKAISITVQNKAVSHNEKSVWHRIGESHHGQ
ncbi:MAG: hypothetical protein KGJ07_00565 [Patescibacteria group bacterium]|nr:hypothetical protein [Patescibacteria group bacterium]